MKRYRGLLFDFDYTLADSSAGVAVCINHALTVMGFSTAEKSRTDRTIGLSLAATFQELTGLADDGQADRFTKLFLEKADDVMVDMTVMLPGVSKAVSRLAERGYRMGIVSTKRHRPIESILHRDDMDRYFAVIVGGDDIHVPKPDPEGVRKTLASMGLTPESALYVGDSATDAMTARNAGMDFAAVLTGVTGREAFADAAAMYENLEELVDALG